MVQERHISTLFRLCVCNVFKSFFFIIFSRKIQKCQSCSAAWGTYLGTKLHFILFEIFQLELPTVLSARLAVRKHLFLSKFWEFYKEPKWVYSCIDQMLIIKYYFKLFVFFREGWVAKITVICLEFDNFNGQCHKQWCPPGVLWFVAGYVSSWKIIKMWKS